MAAAMCRQRTDAVDVVGAGTHSIPGLPMSTRTRTALAEHGASDPGHLSAQLTAEMAANAALIAVFEPMHLTYIRRHHGEVGDRTASLSRFARELPHGAVAELAANVSAMGLAEHSFEPWEEVVDPAGGELPEFQASAAEISGLVDQLIARISGAGICDS